MTQPPARGPLPSQPDEPGWWKASDGQWYPPEKAPGAAPPSAPPAGPATAPMAPMAPPVVAPPGAPPAPTNGLAIAALVCGIASIVICFANIVLGVLGIILGVLGMKKAKELPAESGRGLALGGLVTGVVGVVIGVSWFVFWFAVVVSVDEVARNTSIAIQESGGIADPDDYEVTIEGVETDEFDATICTGEIANASGESRGFAVEVRFTDDSGTIVDDSEIQYLSGLAPGDSAKLEISTFDSDATDCELVDVRNNN